ncbi:MAG TPA: hypothetical protein PLB01_00245 [Thermoanaerobaculia bacterium]|nr:hypothetical protein [Thermoanaerobaculia bacterium]
MRVVESTLRIRLELTPESPFFLEAESVIRARLLTAFNEGARVWALRTDDQLVNARPEYAPDRHLWPFQNERRA